MLSGSVNFLLFAKKRWTPSWEPSTTKHILKTEWLSGTNVSPLYRASRPHHRHGEKSLLNPRQGELDKIIVHFPQLSEHFFISLYIDVSQWFWLVWISYIRKKLYRKDGDPEIIDSNETKNSQSFMQQVCLMASLWTTPFTDRETVQDWWSCSFIAWGGEGHIFPLKNKPREVQGREGTSIDS